MSEPHNRIAVVTGAGSGIGRAAACALVNDGWCVVFSGRRPEALRESIAQAGDPFDDIRARAFAVPADVTKPDAVASLFDFVRARLGRLDLLFNNAGVYTPAASIEDLPLEQWRAAVDTHLTGTFLCTQQAFRMMKAQQPRGGRIVNNGSASAQVPRALDAACTASKHAITGLTRSCALDGRGFDIAVGQIDIGNAAGAGLAGAALQADGSRRVEARIDLDPIAASVLHMANLPLQANVLFMTVMATQMPFVGRG